MIKLGYSRVEVDSLCLSMTSDSVNKFFKITRGVLEREIARGALQVKEKPTIALLDEIGQNPCSLIVVRRVHRLLLAYRVDCVKG